MTVVNTLPQSRPITRADFERMPIPDDGHRYELIDGNLIVSPAPTWQHQAIVGSVYRALHAACPPELMVFAAAPDVVLDDLSVVEPDVCVVRRSDLGVRMVEAPPVLAVEILSPSTRSIDLLLKRERYERARTPAYWVIDPDGPTLTASELHHDEYVEIASTTGEFEAHMPFDVTIDVATLLD